MKPQRIQLSRRKGFNLQEHSRAVNGLEAVKVDRTTKWGNPYRVGEFGTRAECVEALRMLVTSYRSADADREKQNEWLRHMHLHIEDLRGKNLACWCPLPEDGEEDMCHAAVLLEIANR